jgi:bacterioferritin
MSDCGRRAEIGRRPSPISGGRNDLMVRPGEPGRPWWVQSGRRTPLRALPSTANRPSPPFMKESAPISRKQMIRLLNEDLAREYQAIIAYVVYSQIIKGAKFQHIATELEKHAKEELSHAILIAKQIDYLNGTPVVTPRPVKMSDKAEDLLRFDLENERVTILNYRKRIRQADAMGEFAISEILRRIIAEEQDHLTDLADALGIDNPKLGS